MPEGYRQRMHAMGAARHWRRLVGIGESIQFAADGLEIPKKNRVRLFQLQHRPRIEHVLSRRPVMYVLATVARAILLERPQRGNERMFGSANFLGDLFKIDINDRCLM